jgi:hypothetical protein
MRIDDNGVIWQTLAEREEELAWEPGPEDEAELEQMEAEYQEWEKTPEGQAAKAADRAERERAAADPDRLTNRLDHDSDKLTLAFAQGVQLLWDETGGPCRMRDAAERVGMAEDEMVVYCAFAHIRGLIRHPERDGEIATSLWEPAVG